MNAPSFGSNDGPAPASDGSDDFFAANGALRILLHLEQAIAHDDRLIVLTSDDGAGKTTVVQRLVRGFDRHAIWGVMLSATQLATGELPGSLARAFGAPAGAAPGPDVLAGLRRHLAAQGHGRTVLAVVDDAHALPAEAIGVLGELIREGTLRALLVGRPALRLILARQLPLQPASLSCHLEPLQESETPAYIAHRLTRMGWTGTPEFSAEAQALIHRFSRGVPLRVDRLCDRLLRAARRRTEPTIDADAVRRMARPRLDEHAIPMLTSAVDEPLPSGWGASTDLPTDNTPPPWARAPRQPPADTPRDARGSAVAAQRQRRIGVALASVALAALGAFWGYRLLAPPPVDATMTTAPPAEPRVPTPAPPTAAPAPAATAAPIPLPTPPPPAAQSAPPAAARAAPPTATGTPVAPPLPVPGPCTATVAALGLCTPTEAPP
jgi:general secretion pathway protein A